MLSFYPLPQALCVALSTLSAVVVVVQSAALMLNLNRYRSVRVQWLENALEAAILIQIALLSLMIARTHNFMRDDLVIGSGYIAARWIVFGLIAALAAGVYRLRGARRAPLAATTAPAAATAPAVAAATAPAATAAPAPAAAAAATAPAAAISPTAPTAAVAAVVAAALTLPAAESLLPRAFPILYMAALLFWLLCGVYLCLTRLREIGGGISGLSVKEAVDALPTGILFCEEDGYIQLINRRMLALMVALTGAVQRNGIRFYLQLLTGDLGLKVGKSEWEGKVVYRLPDGTVWMFNGTILQIRNKRYHQITAADVTAQWDATALLREQHSELDRKGGDLTEAIANLTSVYRAEEALRARSGIHDTLGQRIAILIHSLRGSDKADMALLRAFVREMSANLMDLAPERPAQESIEELKRLLAGFGVTIVLHGEFPPATALSSVFADIINEGVTNAVRHAFAKEIYITVERRSPYWTLRLTNGGVPPEGPVAETGGLARMRRRLEGLGGSLRIEARPDFILVATLPEDTKE